MIVLDTNVVSEPMKPAPDYRVRDWLDAQARETLYLSTVSLAELHVGVGLLPEGKRRKALGNELAMLLDRLFESRIIAFDEGPARRLVEIIRSCRSAGVSISTADSMIAAVALDAGFSVATRDTGPYSAAGLTVINPWEA